MGKLKPGWLAASLATVLAAGCDPGRTPSIPPPPAGGDIRRDATVNAIELAMPSVVSIATAALNEYRDPYLDYQLRFFGRRAPVQRSVGLDSKGSGVIIDEAGYVITSYHVVSNEFITRAQVKLASGDVYDVEPCVGTTLKDIALLRIKDPQGRKFPAIKFANDDDLILGESVLALGNPYGLGGSVTRGILSAKNRRPSAGDAQLDVPDWLQTDADINPGNSGGPLINLRGEMIGLNARVLREEGGMGVGFAIPVKQISTAMSDFFTPETLNACWFGARIGSFNAPVSVTRVQARGPADLAGLAVGQRILTVNGQPPRTVVDFHRLAMSGRDLQVRLEVEQNGKRRTLTVQMIGFSDLLQQRIGLALRRLTDAEAARLNLKPSDLMVIDGVESAGPADRAGLRPGLLVAAFDETKTPTLLKAAEAISVKQPGDLLRVAFAVPLEAGGGFANYTANVQVR